MVICNQLIQIFKYIHTCNQLQYEKTIYRWWLWKDKYHTSIPTSVGELEGIFTKNVTTRSFSFCFFWTFSIFSFFLREKNPTSTKNQKNCVAFAYPRTFFAWHAWAGTHAGSILRMFHHRKKVYKKHFY